MGGDHLTLPCTLSKNRNGVELHTLADSGANGLAFLNTHVAHDLAAFCNTSLEPLPCPIRVKGYEGKIQTAVVQFLRLHLKIDGRKIWNLPFLVLDLGSQDCILGRHWLDRFNVSLSARYRRLEWPAEFPPSYSIQIERIVKRKDIVKHPINPGHQADADARDRAMATEDALHTLGFLNSDPPGLLRLYGRGRQTYETSLRARIRTMEDELHISPSYVPPPPKPKKQRLQPHSITSYAVDVNLISAAAFHFNLRRPQNELFSTSLYEIDRLIEDKETAEELEQKLPEAYKDYIDVFSKAASNVLPPHRQYDHRIQLTGELPNYYSPLYKQTAEELQATKQYLLDNLDKGFIDHSYSPFASPVLFVAKPNGGLRFCVDYRKLNEFTRKDQYPLPLIDELLTRLTRAKVFTKLDIRQAFHRIRMNPESEELTTFRTRYGSYKCKVLPFGLTNGPATYQRYINDVLFDYLDDFCTAYLDDILIYSDDPLEHEIHVKKVLDRLRAAGLQADIKKSEFGVTRTKYLGFIVTTQGIEVDPEKVAVLRSWKYPRTVKGIQSFLGFCNFYRRFIEEYSKRAKPLTSLTRNEVPFVFEDQCRSAFEDLRQALLSPKVLRHFDMDLKTMLETDASDGVISGILSQFHPDDKLWHPVGFFSKTITAPECNYKIYDKKMLAIVRSLQNWRSELVGVRSTIEVFSDHKALEYFMTTKYLTSRHARWLEELDQFQFQIMYRTGKQNEKADALTRREQDIAIQDQLKKDNRTRVFLHQGQIDPLILHEVFSMSLLPVDEALIEPAEPTLEPLLLVDQLLSRNRESFQKLREDLSDGYTVENGLLLYEGKLLVEKKHISLYSFDQRGT